MTGLWVALGVLAGCTVAGLVARSRGGRVRPSSPTVADAGPPSAHLPDGVLTRLDPAASVTLLQLSTTFCAPCRHTRVLLDDLAGRTDGLSHVEIDLTGSPDLVEPLRVRSTPTTLALDGGGRELFRVHGVPRRDELLAALRPLLPA